MTYDTTSLTKMPMTELKALARAHSITVTGDKRLKETYVRVLTAVAGVTNESLQLDAEMDDLLEQAALATLSYEESCFMGCDDDATILDHVGYAAMNNTDATLEEVWDVASAPLGNNAPIVQDIVTLPEPVKSSPATPLLILIVAAIILSVRTGSLLAGIARSLKQLAAKPSVTVRTEVWLRKVGSYLPIAA